MTAGRDGAPPVWPVFAAYALATVAIVLFSVLAVDMLRSVYPDLSDDELVAGLPALLAGAAAAAAGLIATVVLMARPLSAAALRLVPGRETGRAVGVMVAGMLALGLALDALVSLAGLADRGALTAIRRTLADAAGVELFGAVLIIGVLAGAAEEVFFRGHMQTRLAARWGGPRAVVVTAACFALLHLEWLHVALAFGLGLYLGFVTELSGSVLPALVCHVVNNVAFILLTALVGEITGPGANALLLAATLAAFAACVAWLRTAPMRD